MTVVRTLTDAIWLLEFAASLDADEIRHTDSTAICPECDERVVIFEFQTTLLTSWGRAPRWQTARPHVHRRECFDAHRRRVAALPSADLWER